jgi:hypothetical protein
MRGRWVSKRATRIATAAAVVLGVALAVFLFVRAAVG